MSEQAREPNLEAVAAGRTINGIHSKTHDGHGRDPERQDRLGVLGEAEFCRVFGIDPATVVHAKGPSKVRIRLADGTSVKVYTTAGEYLAISPKYIAEAYHGAYVLAHVTYGKPNDKGERPERCRLIGWATAEEMAAAPLFKLGSSDASHNIRIKWGTLRPIAELVRRNALTLF